MAGGGGEECTLDLRNLQVDWLFLLYCMGGLILVSMVLEYVMHRLETILAHHEHYLRILRRVFKELVILGTLAFVLLMIRDFGRVSHQQFQLIEFAHIWIFLVGFVFVLQALLVMWMTRSVKDRWDRAFLAGPTKLLNEFHEHRNSIRIWPASVRYLLGKPIIMEQLELLVFREFFIRICGLPKSFDFAKYLRRFLSIHIVEDVDVGWHSWALMIMICGVGVLVIHLTEDPLAGGQVDPYHVMIVTIVVTVLNWFFAIVLIMVLERGRDILLHKSGCSDITVLPTTLAVLHNPNRNEFAFVDSVEVGSPTRSSRSRSETGGEYSETSDTFARGPGDRLLASLSDSESLGFNERRIRTRSVDHIKHRHKKQQISVDEIKKFALKYKTRLLDVYPFHRPYLLLFAFEFILLLQCFTVGLILLELVQLSTDGIAVGFLVLALLLHVGMAIFIFPRVVRNWGLLEAICLIDTSSMDIVQDVLRVQEETHTITRRFAIMLYDAFLETLEEVIRTNEIAKKEEEQVDESEQSPLLKSSPTRSANLVFNNMKFPKRDHLDLGPAAIPESSQLSETHTMVGESNQGETIISMDGVTESSSRIDLVTRTISRLSVHMEEGIPLEDYAQQVLSYLDDDNKDERLSKFALLDDERGHNAVLKETFAKLFQKLNETSDNSQLAALKLPAQDTILKKKSTVISPTELPNALKMPPFRFRITEKQCRQMLRTLGCKNGFTIEQFIHIVHVAFRYLSVEDNGDSVAKMKDCFGEDASITCKKCGKDVSLTDIKRHAKKCGTAPNYALKMVTQAVAYINDPETDTVVEILDPLPWTTRPRRLSTYSNMRSLRSIQAAAEEFPDPTSLVLSP